MRAGRISSASLRGPRRRSSVGQVGRRPRGAFSQPARDNAEAAAEHPVEPGKIIQPDLVRDLTDAFVIETAAEQHAMRTDETLIAQKFRESCAVLLEQSLHVTNRNALARSDRLN